MPKLHNSKSSRHLQEGVHPLGVDKDPPRAEVVHLFRHLGDSFLAVPGDGDVGLTPARGDAEGDAAQPLAGGGAPQGVEAAEERYGGADADVGLAEIGKDGENEDRIWVEVKELDLVHLQD